MGINWELPGPGPLSGRIAGTYAKREGLAFAVLGDEDQVVFHAFNARAYASVYFIEPDGAVRSAVTGFVPEWTDSLTARVRLLGSR